MHRHLSTRQKKSRALRKSPRPSSRILFEPLEDRRLLAAVTDDTYFAVPGETLIVTGRGAWLNDTYHESWGGGSHWEDEVEWHEGYTEEPVFYEGWWENPEWYEDPEHENGGYYSPEEPVCHDCYWSPEEPIEHEGYWTGGYVNDGTSHAYDTILTGPQHGTLTRIDSGEYYYDDNSQPIGQYGLAFEYTPDPQFEGIDSFTYELTDDEGSSTATVTFHVAYPQTELAITRFTSVGHELEIAYTVFGQPTGDFPVSIYASHDGFSRDQLLQTVVGSQNMGELGAHSFIFPAAFTDLLDDNYLLAVLDDGDEVDEYIETNNEAIFSGLSFPLATTDGPTSLYITGTAANDSINVVNTGVGSWLVLSGPSPSIDPPPTGTGPSFYDVDGDGKVTRRDALAVAFGETLSDIAWQNPANRFDVNDNSTVTAADLLVLINHHNAFGPAFLNDPRQATEPYFDVSGDNVFSMLDLWQLQDKLNGDDGLVSSDWRNSANPLDVDNDNLVTDNDVRVILDYLGVNHAIYHDLAIDQVTIRSHDGNDQVSAPYMAYSSASLYLFGGEGDDTLLGGANADRLDGGAGNDTLTGSAGDDFLDGGAGNNTMQGGEGGNVIFAGDGDNTISAANGDNTIIAGDGNNPITVGDGSNTIIVGNGSNTIEAGDGGNIIEVGDGDNTIASGDGDDLIVTGNGDNDIDGGNGNDELNGLIERPMIDINADGDVIEGRNLEVIVLLSSPTDHSVSGTLVITAEAGTSAASRWAQTQVSFVIPAGQNYVIVSIATIDNELIDGSNLSTVSLVNVSGAESAPQISSPVYVWDNDDGIVLDWHIEVGENSDSSFYGELRATTNGDGSLTANGVDNHGRPFQAHVTVNRTTLEQTIDLTIQGLPPEDDHWTGTSEVPALYNSRFPMHPDSGNAMGGFVGLLAQKPQERKCGDNGGQTSLSRNDFGGRILTPIGYHQKWNLFMLGEKAPDCGVIVIQKIIASVTVTTNPPWLEDSIEGTKSFPAVAYYEVLGRIPAGKRVLEIVDNWISPTANQPTNGPLVNNIIITQDGYAVAYEDDAAAEDAVNGWVTKPQYVMATIGDRDLTITSGTFPSAAQTELDPGLDTTGLKVFADEDAWHYLRFEFNRKPEWQRLTVDGKFKR